MQRNMVGWFEVPVADMERAIKFYETVLGITLSRHLMGPLDMAWFPWDEKAPGARGSLVRHAEHYKPSTDGILIYFSSITGDLADELARVEPAGGKVLMPKTQIAPDIGFMALFVDTEGNRIALHSRK
jgi:predicted enzyme related to lactoylglutathione lyase